MFYWSALRRLALALGLCAALWLAGCWALQSPAPESTHDHEGHGHSHHGHDA